MSSDRTSASPTMIRRGAFSSFSISLVKSPKEEKLKLPTHMRTFSVKSQSPANQALMNTAGIEQNRSPARRGRSPNRPHNGKPQVTPRGSDETLKNQEISKKLTTHSISENRLSSKKENEFYGLSKSPSSSESENLKVEFEKQKKALSKYKHDNATLAKERDKLLLDLNSSYKSLETTRSALKSLTRSMTDVIYSLLSIEKPVPSADLDSKSDLISQIQTLFISKLKEVSMSTSADLEEEISNIANWSSKPFIALKRRSKQEDTLEISTGDFPKSSNWVSSEKSSDQPNTPKLGSSVTDLHPLNPLKNFKTSKLIYLQDDISPEREISGTKSRQRIRRKSEGLAQLRQFALAIYDFQGERPEDLSFSRGETVEILRTDDSGWWTGKLGKKIGTFPYNFVQLST
jgi:hypothetical protein